MAGVTKLMAEEHASSIMASLGQLGAGCCEFVPEAQRLQGRQPGWSGYEGLPHLPGIYVIWLLMPAGAGDEVGGLPAYCGSTTSPHRGLRRRLVEKQAKDRKGAIRLVSEVAGRRWPRTADDARANVGVVYAPCRSHLAALVLERALLDVYDFAGNRANNGADDEAKPRKGHRDRVTSALHKRLLHSTAHEFALPWVAGRPVAPGGQPELPSTARSVGLALDAAITELGQFRSAFTY